MLLKSASKLVCKQHEFKGHKCLPSDGYDFSMTYSFAEIFDSLDSKKNMANNMVPYHILVKAGFAKV